MKIRQIDRAMQDGSQDKSEKYACVHWTLSGHGFLGVEFGISFHFFFVLLVHLMKLLMNWEAIPTHFNRMHCLQFEISNTLIYTKCNNNPVQHNGEQR